MSHNHAYIAQICMSISGSGNSVMLQHNKERIAVANNEDDDEEEEDEKESKAGDPRKRTWKWKYTMMKSLIQDDTCGEST